MDRNKFCNIGCNIVDPACDDSDSYTEQVYYKNLELYRGYGIRHIEFSHVMVLDEASAGRIREFCRSLGVIPWSIHSEHLNGGGEKMIGDYLAVQQHCCRIARTLDAQVVVCHIPNIEPRAGNFNRDLKILTKLADITRNFGLKLAIETPPYDYIIKLVDTIGRADVGMNLDTGHCALEGNDPADVAYKIGHRLFTTHLQDNFGVNDDHQTPGMGLINWRKLLTAFKDIGYTGPLLMELTGEGVKARRSALELRHFELEKEIVFGKNYLEYLWADTASQEDRLCRERQPRSARQKKTVLRRSEEAVYAV